MDDFGVFFLKLLGGVGGAGSVCWGLVSIYFSQAKELEKIKASNTRSALNRLNDEVKDFRSAVSNIQGTIKDLNTGLVQNRADIGLFKERLDDTKKMIERYEKGKDDTVKNMIKTEIQDLTKKIMLIRTNRGGS